MTNKIYDEQIVVSGDLDKQLKKTLVNHLLVYNHCLNTLYTSPETDFQSLKRIATKYIESKALVPIISSAMFNELYYQYKKFRKNVRVRKLLTDIQYLTFTVANYNNSNFELSDDKAALKLIGMDGEVGLEKPLPEISGDKPIYVNISYSSRDNIYRLNVYSYQ